PAHIPAGVGRLSVKSGIKRFCFPESVAEAARLAARYKGKALILAGGTRRPAAVDPRVETVIDLCGLPLRHVKAGPGGLRIGALCTLAELERSPLAGRWAGGILARAVGFVGGAPIRHMGTVGGNVARPHPANNLPPVLLALGARAACRDGGRQKEFSFAQLLEPKFMAELGRRYLLTEIIIPAQTRSWAGACLRLAATKTDWNSTANVAVAVRSERGSVRQAAIAVGALLPRAARLAKTEAALAGLPATEASARRAQEAAAAELAGLGAKEFARNVAAVLVRRALLEAFGG
ncbi:MAG: FAD binding domain-containing protein, partial [Elusimicrobia bacterium]|nr:FAD binding domain-containing protein [Elusimicrobiota bacterium]